MDSQHDSSNAPATSAPAKKNWKADVLVILKSRPARITVSIMVVLVTLRLGLNWWLNRAVHVGARVVKVTTFAPQTIDKTLSLPANIEAIEEATLYAHVSGYLKKIDVDEGDKVKKDQLLAVIDAPDVVQEYRNAKADYDFKETTRKRYEELLKEQVVSQQEYDKVEADANQAKARFENAQANLDYTYVRSPFTGAIARRYRYPGDFISAPTKGGQSSPLFLLVNENRLRVAVNVPQRDVAHITPGHESDVRVDAFPDRTFSGKVSRVDEVLDEATKTQRVLVDIDNPDDLLHAGMFATVVMHLERRDNVPMIAKEAVESAGDQSYVFVVKDGKAVRVQVEVKDSTQDAVEVQSPKIGPKDQFVVGGLRTLVDGDPVKVEGMVQSGRPQSQQQSAPTEKASAPPSPQEHQSLDAHGPSNQTEVKKVADRTR